MPQAAIGTAGPGWPIFKASGPSVYIQAADDQAQWHDFHDQFLSYGGPPIPLLRKEMLGEEGSLL